MYASIDAKARHSLNLNKKTPRHHKSASQLHCRRSHQAWDGDKPTVPSLITPLRDGHWPATPHTLQGNRSRKSPYDPWEGTHDLHLPFCRWCRHASSWLQTKMTSTFLCPPYTSSEKSLTLSQVVRKAKWHQFDVKILTLMIFLPDQEKHPPFEIPLVTIVGEVTN
jgi:hypothetical protein